MSSGLYDGAIHTHSVVEADDLIEGLFPEQLIFRNKPRATLSSFWEDFNAGHPNAWAEFTGHLHRANSEVEVALFLETLIMTIPTERSWSAANKAKSPGGDALRKPDLVCFDRMKSNSDDWGHFMSVGELKSGDFKDVYGLLVERAALLFRNQDSRRFVLTFALVKEHMTIAFFDRGGSIVSQPFDVCHHHHLFLQFILGLTYAPLTALGYDSTITTHPKCRTLSSSYIPNVHILCVLYVAERTHGRGTVVWLAKLKHIPDVEVPEFIGTHFGEKLSIDPAVIIKDIWADESTSLTEGLILALLKEKGVQGVPRILAEERVLSERPDDEVTVDRLSGNMKPYPMPNQARPDSTTQIRSRLKLSRPRLSETALKSAQQASQLSPPIVGGFEARSHIRSYITPWAVPIFQFRSGIELLGVIVDTLTAHEQAASSYFVESQLDHFPFSFLHRDPSLLNMGMVPSEESDFPPCPHRSNGEHRGLLYDWGFAKVTEVAGYEDPWEMDEDENEDERIASSDTDMAPRSTIHIPEEHRTDCGLHTATPDIISDLGRLVKLVQHCVREEEPALEITGTRPFMAIELLVASLVYTENTHGWKDNNQGPQHEVRHDLEAFYMVLVSLCLLYEKPHVRKGLGDYDKPGAFLLPEEDVLPLCAVLWLSGQEELNTNNIRFRFLALCTREGFGTMVKPYISSYFTPMVPYLERIRALLYGGSSWWEGPYKRPDTHPTHDAFRKILYDAMKTIPSTTHSEQFSLIVEPPQMLYCPISPKGEWQGKAFSWELPMPMRSNNTYGFVEDQVTSSLPVPFTLASTTGSYVKVPHASVISSPPTTYRANTGRGSISLRTKGLKASSRYPVIPEVDRLISERIRSIRGLIRATKKPYMVHSPSQISRRRMKWDKPVKCKKGKEKCD